jgi:hypothetical protein
MTHQSRRIPEHTRNIEARFITFECLWCKETVTLFRFPGNISYCSDRCRLDAAAFRKREQRAKTGKNRGKRGRPRKQAS